MLQVPAGVEHRRAAAPFRVEDGRRTKFLQGHVVATEKVVQTHVGVWVSVNVVLRNNKQARAMGDRRSQVLFV